MSSQMWKLLYSMLRRVNRKVPRMGRRTQYSDVLIVAMYLWSVAHDRPMLWATDRANYGRVFRPRRLPSVSQFYRRIQSPRCQALLQALHEALADAAEVSKLSFIDGRAFVVGAYSTDADAHVGKVSGGFARGYKLHAMATADGRFTHFRVEPLNVSEQKVAPDLIAEAPLCGVLVADSNYDSRALYEHALNHGALLFTPLPENAGGGHHPYCWPRMLAKSAWDRGYGLDLYKQRNAIERYLGQLSAFGGGLAPLPAWVRRLPRVRRWITAKVIFYHVRWRIRNAAA